MEGRGGEREIVKSILRIQRLEYVFEIRHINPLVAEIFSS